MATAVTICSNALLMLGAQTINSFSETNNRAQICANLYPQVRDRVLRSHAWNCAVKRVVLAQDADAPAFDYSYQYSLPNDWLRTLSVGQYGMEADYKTEGKKILCDESSLQLRYVARVTESQFDAGLVEVMSLAIAAAIAYAITGSAAKEQAMQQQAEMALRRARAVDGQDDPPETLGDFSLLNARRNWG